MIDHRTPPPSSGPDLPAPPFERPLTILMMNHLTRWTASKSYSYKLARWLSEAGHRVLYFGPTCADIDDQRCEPLPNEIVRIPSPPMTNVRVPDQALHLARIVRAERIDVLHANLPIDHNLALFARLLARRPVAVVRNKHFLRPLKNANSPISRVKYSRMTDRMLATCRAIADVLSAARCIDPSKVRVVYEGLELGRFVPDGKPPLFRDELGIPRNLTLVGMIATYRDTKAHGDFVAAAARIRERNAGVHFLVAGDGDRTIADRVRADVAARGLSDAFTFAGYRDDVPSILPDLALGVVPSTQSDAAGRICMEYMAAGTPAVVTDIGAYPEFVADGVTGRVVPPASPDRIADAALDLLSDPARHAAMRKAARKRAERMLGKDAFVDRIVGVYREALAERSARALRSSG